MNLYKSLIFILYLGIFLGSGFRTPAQSRDSITLYGTLDTVQVIRQRIQHANEANAGARVTHISPAILQANKTRSLAELLTDHTSIYIKSLGTGISHLLYRVLSIFHRSRSFLQITSTCTMAAAM